MGPDREEVFSLREIRPVVEQVLFSITKMLAVVAEKLHFWKSKLPVNVEDVHTFESMVVGTADVLAVDVDAKRERQ